MPVRFRHLVVIQGHVTINMLTGCYQTVEAGGDYLPEFNIFANAVAVIKPVAGLEFMR
jgi:hypothetical protein